jgi:hypothetical protein
MREEERGALNIEKYDMLVCHISKKRPHGWYRPVVHHLIRFKDLEMYF